MRGVIRGSLVALTGTVLALLATPAPAHHTLLHLGGGTLSISQPATSNLGTVPAGATSVQAPLGTVTVHDARGLLNLGSYTVQVSSTGFTTSGSGGFTYTIPARNVSYAPPLSIGGNGTAVRTAGPGGTLDVNRVAMRATLVAGDNTSTWNPTITVTIPADAVAGTYTGVITHSVA